jgi:hypothetical protein
MVKKVKKEYIKDCGSTIYELHNMCFFLCLYNALGYNQKDEKNKKLFYDKCKVIAIYLPKTGEMIDTVCDSNAIRILAQHFNAYIRIYPTLNTLMSEYISDNPVTFGYSGSKQINIIHVGNHYMLLNIDPDRLTNIHGKETLELANKARQYQTSFIEQMDKDAELAQQLQEEYIKDKKDAELAKQFQDREEQKDAELAMQFQAREELEHKKYIIKNKKMPN